MVADIPKGTRWHQIAGGGGGYGNPRQRPVKLVEQEVHYGYVSAKAALDEYGVIIDPRG
jgi:N-methylhydantoinase B